LQVAKFSSLDSGNLKTLVERKLSILYVLDSHIEISQHNDGYFASNFIISLRKKQNYYINLSYILDIDISNPHFPY